MHKTIRDWIIEILKSHEPLLTIAVRQRAKFEGWLKFELAACAEKHGVQCVKVESAYDESNLAGKKSDISFYFNDVRYDIELKTPNSSWRMPGVHDKTRDITTNFDGIVRDAKKLCHSHGRGIAAFVLFPIPPNDNQWTKYLDRISKSLEISLTPQEHCERFPIVLEENHTADLIICCFSVNLKSANS